MDMMGSLASKFSEETTHKAYMVSIKLEDGMAHACMGAQRDIKMRK